MRSFICSLVLISSVLAMSGCSARPELPVSAYGTIHQELPVLTEAEKPFPFPMEGDNDHQNCVFDEMDFM